MTVWLQGILSAQKLPFLAFPFIFTSWIVSLSSWFFTNLELDASHVYTENTQKLLSTNFWYQWIHTLDGYSLPSGISLYLKSMASLLYGDSLLAGILVSLSVLLCSRVAFIYTVITFFSAYIFFKILGVDTSILSSQLAGSNYLFIGLALGAFFLLPNRFSLLLVILLTPVVTMMHLFMSRILAVFQLPAYTISFCMVTILVLYFLHQRWLKKWFIIPYEYTYSPEVMIYQYQSDLNRYKNAAYANISLPFWGEWMVSQGYDGKITHLGSWSKALDFVILDHSMKTYQHLGQELQDFYCYAKPILAPASGYVQLISNYVDENEIGRNNSRDNWGNSILINHQNGLYSQISHVLKDSFTKAVGDYVQKGDIIAYCGNSGRSPEPHIHFQLQTKPIIGDQTFAYPIACFLERRNGKLVLKEFEVPEEGTFVSNLLPNAKLKSAYNFEPGVNIKAMKNGVEEHWGVYTDEYNYKYFYCKENGAIAYFYSTDVFFYFTKYIGDKSSLLFQFYLLNYKVLLSDVNDISIQDAYPLHIITPKWLLWMQDMISPFYLFLISKFYSSGRYVASEDIFEIETEGYLKFFRWKFFRQSNKIIIDGDKLSKVGDLDIIIL